MRRVSYLEGDYHPGANSFCNSSPIQSKLLMTIQGDISIFELLTKILLVNN